MLKPKNIVWLLFAALIAVAVVPTAVPQTKASVPKHQDKRAMAENEFKQLLLLMDVNKDGKISKQEYMRFLEAEFDRIDTNHDGELEVTELTDSKAPVTRFTSAGK